jgi:hypothetical protein
MSTDRFNPDGLALSANYAETMNEAVLPWINARRRDDVSVTGSELRNNSIKIEKLSASAIDRLRS